MVPEAEPRSYYGRPVIKEPVWKPEVPWYFFAGGLTGASAMLAYVAGVSGNQPLARRAWLVTMVAGTASPVLLIADLGRPERFFNMLRVFKVTSPISVGSWILSAMGSSVAIAAADEMLGLFPRLGRVARASSALLGLPMATYTAALISNSAVPVWAEARRELPFVFAGSAAASAGAATAILTPRRYAGPARRLTVVGAALEGVAMQAMERGLGELGEPYRKGAAGRYLKLAKSLTGAGTTLVALQGAKRRSAAVAGGALVLAAGVLLRWAVFKAGFQSARDPKFTVGPQRRRAGRRDRANVG